MCLLAALALTLVLASAARASECNSQFSQACTDHCTGIGAAMFTCSMEARFGCWDHPTNPHVIQCGTRVFATCTCVVNFPGIGTPEIGDPQNNMPTLFVEEPIGTVRPAYLISNDEEPQ